MLEDVAAGPSREIGTVPFSARFAQESVKVRIDQDEGESMLRTLRPLLATAAILIIFLTRSLVIGTI